MKQVQEKKAKAQKKEKKVVKTHTEIKCQDCGKMREVKVQDAHQVKRCVECQVKHTRTLRKEYKKNRVKTLRDEVIRLQKILDKNEIEY